MPEVPISTAAPLSRTLASAGTTEDTPVRPDQASSHVLIVEGDQRLSDRLRADLADNADHTIATGPVTTSRASTLTEALDLLDAVHVDCVVLDLGLRDTHGLDGLHAILDRHPTATVVVLTRRQNDVVAHDAVHAGAQDHLCTQGLSANTLQRSVGYAIERTRAHTAERRLAKLLSRAAEVVLVIDPERVVTYASTSIQSVLGYRVDQVVGRPGAFFTHPEDLSGLRAALMAAVIDPEVRQDPFVVRAIHADGSHRWGEVTIDNQIGDPAIGGLVLNIRDITERHDMTMELEIEHARRDAIVARSSDMVVFFENDGTIAWASPAANRLFGVEPQALLGLNGLELIHPEDQERVFADFATIANLGDHVRTEFRVLDLDGNVRWIEETATNLVDDPIIGVVVGNLRDITDRKTAEEAVVFQARLLGAAGQAIIAFDDVGVILYWNHAAQDTFGWTDSEAVGRHVAELIPPVDTWERKLVDILARLRDAQVWSGEFRLHRKDGSEIPVHISHTPLIDDLGNHLATIGVYSDISERQKGEAAAALLSSIVESSNDAIFSNDLDGSITTWNTSAAELYGYTSSEIIGRHLSLLAPSERADELVELLTGLRRGGSVKGNGTLRRRADGSEFHVSMSMSPLRDPAGQVVGASVIARDITERVELSQQLEMDRRHLADAQASARLGSIEVDLATGEFHGSAEFWRILGRTPGPLGPASFGGVHPDDRDRVRRSFETALDGVPGVECTHRIVRPDGEIRWVISRSSKDTMTGRATVTGTMLDITERRQAELAIEHVAYHDQLTGLSNRMALTQGLDHLLATTRETGEFVAVAMLDVDQFKSVNDTLGHSTGDIMLRAVARRLEEAVLLDETLARFGGDEFVVVQAGLDGPDGCVALGDRLLDAFSEAIVLGEREFRISVSVGVALGRPGDTSDQVLLQADTAMYHAKDLGRAQVAMFDEELQVRNRRRHDIEDALREALELDEFDVVFQPVLDLATLRTSGFEALLRWTHPVLGVIGPDEFIPIAEETGLILSIGEWVLRHSLRQLGAWHDLLPPAERPWMAVNLSARQLERSDLVDSVAAALSETGVAAQYLHLEITESILMESIEHSLERLLALRRLGIRISIDDFGTGYSSLSYLKRLPIDTLKIDRSFIDGLGRDPDDTSIVQAIISLARTLHLQVLAEGIEDETQLAALIELGCDLGQGFLWSPGVPPDPASAWLGR